jgi:hypothetical protein
MYKRRPWGRFIRVELAGQAGDAQGSIAEGTCAVTLQQAAGHECISMMPMKTKGQACISALFR